MLRPPCLAHANVPPALFHSSYPLSLIIISLLLASVLLAGCDAAPAEQTEEPGVLVEGVDLTRLFAPPSQNEIDAIRETWASRRSLARTVENFQGEVQRQVRLGKVRSTARVVSHTVGGVKHYGAIIAPTSAPEAGLPVVVLAHGGDGGVDVDELLGLLSASLGDVAGAFVFVIPSFRAEPLVFDGKTYVSDGPPSPWDLDVDDTLALLTAALEHTPSADPERIGVVGFSLGAGVALLMGVRDERVDVVVEFFGPTDFYGELQQLVVANLLRYPETTPFLHLPGVRYLNEAYVQPLKRGELTIEEVRPELTRRSPVYFTDALERFRLQIHHGMRDTVVPVEQGQRLIEVMLALDRNTSDFEYYLYENGTHDPLTMPGSFDRTLDFLHRHLVSSQASF